MELRPTRALLIYDGDCAFCKYWVQRWHRTAGERFDFVAAQAADVRARVPELSAEALAKEVHLIEPDGRVSRGAEAVFRALGSKRAWLGWAYQRVPGFAPVAEAAYRLVAENRRVFSWLTRVFWGAKTFPPTFVVTRWLFLRGMGLCYLVAFWSLWVQIDGLVGSGGIIPAADQLSGIRAQAKLQGIGSSLYWFVPTFCWFESGDGALGWQCLAGVVLAGLVMVGVMTGPCLVLLWMFYLSLATVCGVFLGYQWDNLLLEAGLLSCWVGPWRWLERLQTRPPPLGRWLLLALLFRLMFSSGCVKLASGDLSWLGLTALEYHYQTQPLPTWIGWHVHQWPGWAHTGSTVLMFAIELVVPFFVFGPRRVRLAAFWAFVGLMGLIGLTGNYGFFNLITLILCLWLLDDQAILRLGPPQWRNRWLARVATMGRIAQPWPWWEVLRRVGLGAMVLVYALVTAALVTGLFGNAWPATGLRMAQGLAPIRSMNHYGLFAVMITQRPEIILEGSQDGQRWEPYWFKYKAGELDGRPAFAGFHMPRLDWQMWFAALEGDYRRSPWFTGFARRLLEGSPAVLNLMGRNPFPEGPPRYLRARMFDYRFTSREERARTGAWWDRKLIGEYCPVISLRDGRE